MTTSDKGDIGEAKILVDLLEKGLEVLKPISAHADYDLAVNQNGRLVKVQVKYIAGKNGTLIADLTKVSLGCRERGKVTGISQCDVVAIYCPSTNECYYVLPTGKKNISLRMEPTAKQWKHIRKVEDHRDFPVIR